MSPYPSDPSLAVLSSLIIPAFLMDFYSPSSKHTIYQLIKYDHVIEKLCLEAGGQ
jgi:hypothetical protein